MEFKFIFNNVEFIYQKNLTKLGLTIPVTVI